MLNSMEDKILNFKGVLLIPLNNNKSASECTEFKLITLDKDTIYYTSDISESKEQLIAYCKIEDKNYKWISDVIAYRIQTDDKLMKVCRRHRVGFNYTPKDNKNTHNNTKKIKSNYKCNRDFVIKVLKAKKNWKNLNNFIYNKQSDNK